ncbi:hypothetical protein [Algoriphagus namhaensis]
MRKFFYIAFLSIVTLAQGLAQDEVSLAVKDSFTNDLEQHYWEEGKNEPLLLFKAVDAQPLSSQTWNDLVEELKKKKSKTRKDYNFLRSLFQKTHKHLLKNYEQHSTFNDMLVSGNFDCVSGSAALGLLLEKFDYDFDIIETDYHVFIMVHLEGKDIILESTLPIGGLIAKTSEVQRYLDSYKPKENATLGSISTRIGNIDAELTENSIFRKVNLTQLAGLLYYNDAIRDFNSQRYQTAVQQLEKAYALYHSDRIAGLKDLSEDLASGKKLLARH